MPDRRQHVRIIVRGILDPVWQSWFAGLELTPLHPPAQGLTELAGTLPDQAAVHGVLEKIRDLNIELVSVTCQ